MLQINSNQTIRFQLQFLILLIFTISDLEIRINEVGSFSSSSYNRSFNLNCSPSLIAMT